MQMVCKVQNVVSELRYATQIPLQDWCLILQLAGILDPDGP